MHIFQSFCKSEDTNADISSWRRDSLLATDVMLILNQKKKKKDTVGSRFYYNPWWAGVAFQSRDYSRTGLPLPPIQPWMWLPNRNKEAFNIRGAPIVDTVFGNITKKIATSSVVFPTTLLF